MSGWKIDSPKYKITEALFNEIWESLEVLADIDKDGKITKTEWVSKKKKVLLYRVIQLKKRNKTEVNK